jgi:thioredoxin 1
MKAGTAAGRGAKKVSTSILFVGAPRQRPGIILERENMSEDNFFQRLRQNPNPVVVDFWAPWCAPCKMIEPQLKKLHNEFEGRVDVWKINADEHPELMRQLRIYGIPTLIGFKGGEEVVRQTGAAAYPDLAALFESALSGEKPAAVQAPLTLVDRFLRVAIAAALFFLAYSGNFQGVYLLFAGLSGLALFSAVYDRCPVWQALAPQLKSLLGRKTEEE